ncbi:hypothetical protein HDV63DRAFT_325705 [Trichoderma sp. SZMC 28014]
MALSYCSKLAVAGKKDDQLGKVVLALQLFTLFVQGVLQRRVIGQWPSLDICSFGQWEFAALRLSAPFCGFPACEELISQGSLLLCVPNARVLARAAAQLSTSMQMRLLHGKPYRQSLIDHFKRSFHFFNLFAFRLAKQQMLSIRPGRDAKWGAERYCWKRVQVNQGHDNG